MFFDSFRLSSLKLNMFSIITFASIILFLIFADIIISNISLHNSDGFANGSNHHDRLQTHTLTEELKVKSTDDGLVPVVRPENKLRREELELFETSVLGRRFDSRVEEFLCSNQCRVQFFMTWISPVDSFGEREFFVLESLFQTNPKSCLIILSKSMDSDDGYKILKPLIHRGCCIRALTPDLWDLFNNTPAAAWIKDIKNGNKDPGEIPLAQNLSNLMRLAVLYKYGGVYLDTDFIVLKDFSGLKNSIGAQSIDIKGNWTRLNNAVLVFDRNHPLVYMFMEEFAFTFDGNRWGHNGPYLVSRVVDRVAKNEEFNFTILPPLAFYPVDWTRIPGFFVRPTDQTRAKWIEAKIRQLSGSTYGVHLWNRQTRRLKIEEGSIIERLISDHCVICSSKHNSTSFKKSQISLLWQRLHKAS